MMGSNELYSELYELRGKLRETKKDIRGRVPEICSDVALTEMSLSIPMSLEELGSIKGLDRKFVSSYGEEFLEVIKRHASSDYVPDLHMDKKTSDILRELEKKLVNINKRNRMLYQGKLHKNLAFDLSGILGEDIYDILFGKKMRVHLCDLAADKGQIETYKTLSGMIREAGRSSREMGRDDLFLAFPFIQGKLPGEDFDIRAPLALFPVKLEKDSRHVTLSVDRDRDAIYNGTLILAYLKMAGENRPMPDLTIQRSDREDFFEKLLKFYSDQGISLEPCQNKPVPFKEYKAGEFPKYLPGRLQVVPNLVVGRYPSYSSSIHLDFENMIETGKINNALNNLLKDFDPNDFQEMGRDPLSVRDIKEKGMGASEKDLLYINLLNSAQENVLTWVQKTDELVIQGPPGTGKSQVITALIVSEIMHGRNILMISEKKTALDVVYSRLGALSKYCVIADDAGNKEDFYSQIKRMMEPTSPKGMEDLDEISSSIDRNFETLEGIAERMYEPDEFGLSPYKLYSMERWLDLNDRYEYEEYKELRKGIDPRITSLSYSDINDLYKTFSNPKVIKGFEEYHNCLERTPWIKDIRSDLSEYDLAELRVNVRHIEDTMSELSLKNAISRSRGRKRLVKKAEVMVNAGFVHYDKTMPEFIVDRPQDFIDGLVDYERFLELDSIYSKMGDIEKVYGNNLLELAIILKYRPQQCNDQIIKYVLNERLQRFDADNKDLMQHIKDFDRIISDIDRKIYDKMDLSKDSAEHSFQISIRNMTDSVRRGDIMRVADSKKKWNIKRFVERFETELFDGIRVWLMTPDAVSEILPLRMGLFDLVIFDEASQMYVERGIPAIYRGKRIVISGDHKQLRPSSLGFGRLEYEEGEMDDEAALEEESLLDLARARYDSILLNFHYRSKYEELIAFSNHAFYDGELYVAPNIREPEKPPIEMHKVKGVWDNTRNKAEAVKIIELLRDFFITRRDNETVGILTFNAAQRDLITDMLDSEMAKDRAFSKVVNEEMNRFDNGEDVGLFIKNIETVQGDERDVIMFSIGYAPNPQGRMMQRFGWLNNQGGENRLNVAVSRAKQKVHLITSIEPEDLKVDDLANNGPRMLRKYMQYARAISNRDRSAANTILQSLSDGRWDDTPILGTQSSISDRVYNSLVRKGYTVDRNVGIGGYQIDLAVKQNGNYILGIETDGHLYNTSGSARERDYHRQKYLEINGWNIHRVWTPGMWKDPEREISLIVKAIEGRN
ncbi:MAG TPA: AAA domain-containing protein [Candidatus Methanomethylophilaceae archaeon]|nr:AAA domain-containing protein [Candidatus Methanomethylophilaceae archaeon]